jgi:hypothetical protein
LQRGVSASLTLSAFEKSILKAATPQEQWAVISGVLPTFGFAGARLVIGPERMETWNDHIPPSACWRLHVPLSDRGDYVEFAREVGSMVLPTVVVPFVDLVATTLSAKLVEPSATIRPLQTAAVRPGV